MGILQMECKILSDEGEIKKFILENTPKNIQQFYRTDWIKFVQSFFNYEYIPLGVINKNEIVAFLPLFYIKSLIFKNHFVSIPHGQGGEAVIKNGLEKDQVLKILF